MAFINGHEGDDHLYRELGRAEHRRQSTAGSASRSARRDDPVPHSNITSAPLPDLATLCLRIYPKNSPAEKRKNVLPKTVACICNMICERKRVGTGWINHGTDSRSHAYAPRKEKWLGMQIWRDPKVQFCSNRKQHLDSIPKNQNKTDECNYFLSTK